MTHPDPGHPLDYPERADIARERAQRIAAIAAQCGEIIPRGALHHPDQASAEDEEVLVRDDTDAAIRFFDAVRAERIDAEEEAASESAGATTLDFSRFRARRIRERLLVLLDRLIVAIERRDLDEVWSVLDEADACRCFPPALREEALLIGRLPATSFRAPMRLYRYYHLLSRLGDEPLEVAQDPAQLAIDLEPSPSATPVRELRFPERRAGGQLPGPDPFDGGSDRRRSGSR